VKGENKSRQHLVKERKKVEKMKLIIKHTQILTQIAPGNPWDTWTGLSPPQTAHKHVSGLFS
jgi:hypothetical protein